MSPPQTVIDLAVSIATESPCAKSKRGVVVFDVTRAGTGWPVAAHAMVIGRGFNGLPPGYTCDGTDSCRRECAKRCVHAEERAIRTAIGSRDDREDAEMLADFEAVHVKVVDGALIAGGGPSCWQCSRTVLDVRLGGFWLYEHRNDGPRWVRYSAEEFHKATLEACGL